MTGQNGTEQTNTIRQTRTAADHVSETYRLRTNTILVFETYRNRDSTEHDFETEQYKPSYIFTGQDIATIHYRDQSYTLRVVATNRNGSETLRDQAFSKSSSKRVAQLRDLVYGWVSSYFSTRDGLTRLPLL